MELGAAVQNEYPLLQCLLYIWFRMAISSPAGSVTSLPTDLTSLAKQDVWLWSERLQQQAQHGVGG